MTRFTALGFAFVLSAGPALAEWPTEPLHVIVPFAAGSTGEVVGRLLGEAIEKEAGVPVVVETKPGGAGMIGAAAVVNARPDGHTFLFGATNNFVINQFLLEVPFDPLTDLAPVSKVVDVPSVIAVPSSLGVSTLAEFTDYAKAHPGEVNYASPGLGTTPQLNVERYQQMTGTELTHVSYQGGGPAMTSLLSGETQLYLAGSVLVKPHVDAGTVTALAVGASERLSSLPDVPTTNEAGMPDFMPGNWWGLAAPKDTPPDVVAKMQSYVAHAIADPDVARKLDDLGLVGIGNTPDAFAADLVREAAEWKQVIGTAGMEGQ